MQGSPFAGIMHVCGFEQEHIPDLAPLMQAGVKVPINLLTLNMCCENSFTDMCLRRFACR